MNKEKPMWAAIAVLIIALVYTYYNPKGAGMIQSSPALEQKQ